MDADSTTTAARRFDRLSWALGFATGLLLGTVIVAWAVLLGGPK